MYHIIINPASCSGNGLKIWKEQIEPRLKTLQITYRSYFTQKDKDVAVLAKEIAAAIPPKETWNLIILGGDGTINGVLQGIQDPSRLIIGYIPTGSSNDLARDLKISKKPLEALDAILFKGSLHKMDLGTITYPDNTFRHFVVSCGIGFDAAVCEEALHSPLKKVLNRLKLGKLTYLFIALKQLLVSKAVSCEILLDGGSSVKINKVLFVTCMLHRFEGGGFQFCPDADATDGILNLCTVGNLPKLLILFALPTAFWGKHYFVKGITSYHAHSVTLRCSSPLWVHTDGEVVRKTQELTVACHQKALTFIY